MPGRGSSVWNIWSINTVVQYNMCLSTRGYLDSYGIHIDIENENTFVQYNYMYDCEGGFVEILAGNKNAVYRFNVDVNSGFRVSDWNNASSTIYIYSDRWKEPNQAALNLNDGVYINNNTIVINKGTKDNGDPYTTTIFSDAKNTYIYNNIFSSTNNAGIGKRNFNIIDNNSPFIVTNNLFEGTILQDWVNMDTNPQKGAALFSGSGNDKYPYQVIEGSLAINNGVAITGPIIPGAGTGVFENLSPYPTVDLYGNPIDLSTGTPNIGAYNGKTNSQLSTNSYVIKDDNNWIVYPTENKKNLNIINHSGTISGKLKVALYNIRGQMIQRNTLESLDQNKFILNLETNLANGIYILRLENNGKTHSRRIIFQR